jgi:hypothetical protein
MLANVFEATAKAIWEDDVDIKLPTIPEGHESRHALVIAQFLFGGTIQNKENGVAVVVFPDGSFAICGTRGSSILTTGYVPDVADPESWESEEYAEDTRAHWAAETAPA